MTTVVARSSAAIAKPEPPEVPGVVVRQAILHLVGSQRRLSNRPLALTDGAADFGDYLRTHITQALADPQLRSAVAPGAGPDTAVALGDALARGEAAFVATSVRLAELLHDAIDGDRRVREGVFAVATCTRTADQRNFVALLKLDLGLAFQTEWRSGGYLAVRPLSDTLPATGERLQKAAFVSAVDQADSQHLLVIDRQVHDVPAKFFLDRFLHAALRFGDAFFTRRLYQALHAARRTLTSEIPANRLASLDDTIHGIFARSDIDLDDTLSQLPDKERNTVEREVTKRHLDRAFTLDQAVLYDLTRTKRFRGDYGLMVEVDADYVDIVIEEGAPDKAGKRTILLHTKEWSPQWPN